MNRPRSLRSASSAEKKNPAAPKSIIRSRRQSADGKENPKLAALKRKHFTKRGRAARIDHALKTLNQFSWDFGLDDETLKWAAEDPDIEHF
jgi:hypothetical protein